MRSILKILAIWALLTLACSSTAVAPRVFEITLEKQTPVIPVTAAEGLEACGGTVMPVINYDYEQAVVEQTNEIRMKAGLTPLKRVEDLDKSARFHAADMSISDYFSHDTFNRSDTQLVEVCNTWERIESFYKNWNALAENIAAGQRVPQQAMDGWMNSPDHRHNILSDSYWEIGVGYFEGQGEYYHYWVQNFGRTNGRYPLIINGEKARTQLLEVSVFIYGDWQAMRLRVDDGEWSPWMDFQQSFSWMLPDSDGTHTITAELRSLTESTSSADSILLERQGVD